MPVMAHDFSSCKTVHRASHTREVTGVKFNCDGAKLAASGDSSSTHIYDVSRLSPHNISKEHTTVCKGHSGNIECVTWHPTNPQIFATCGTDRTVLIYDVRSGTQPNIKFTADHTCLKVAWADNDTMLITDQEDNMFKIQPAKEDGGRHLAKKEAYRFKNLEMNQFACGVDRVYIACGDGIVTVLKWPSLEEEKRINAHVARCYALALEPTGTYFAVASDDATVGIWNARILCNMYVTDRFVGPVRVAAYSHDSKVLALAENDEKRPYIKLIAAKSGYPHLTIDVSASVNSMDWNPQTRLLAYSLDRQSRTDAADGAPNFNVWGYPPRETGRSSNG